jgi:hypothetical protein
MRYSPLGRAFNLVDLETEIYYHAFLVVYDNAPGCSGPPYYFRGGPQRPFNVTTGGGLLTPSWGVYRPGTPDWGPISWPTQSVLANGKCCKCYIAMLRQIMLELVALKLMYSAVGNNSNAVAFQALEEFWEWTGWCKGRPPPKVWAPGWDTSLRPIPGKRTRPLLPECIEPLCPNYQYGHCGAW